MSCRHASASAVGRSIGGYPLELRLHIDDANKTALVTVGGHTVWQADVPAATAYQDAAEQFSAHLADALTPDGDERAAGVETDATVEAPYYEVTVRLPLDRYTETWFDHLADAAGADAAVSGTVVPGRDEPDSGGPARE